MKLLRWVKAVWPVHLQVTLATVGVGGVPAVAARAVQVQRGVVWRIEEDRVRLALG